jgi:hypothetical protein
MDISKTPRPMATFAEACFWIGTIMTLTGVVIMGYAQPGPMYSQWMHSLAIWGYKMGFSGGVYMFVAPVVRYSANGNLYKHHYICIFAGLCIAVYTGSTLERAQMLNEGTFWLFLVPPGLIWFKTKFTKNKGDRLTTALRKGRQEFR